jgi:hypothetical protein
MWKSTSLAISTTKNEGKVNNYVVMLDLLLWLLCVERSKPIQHRDAPQRSGATQYYQENACAFRPAENDPRRWWPPATQIECNDSEKSTIETHESCVLLYLVLVCVSVNRPSFCCVRDRIWVTRAQNELLCTLPQSASRSLNAMLDVVIMRSSFLMVHSHSPALSH